MKVHTSSIDAPILQFLEALSLLKPFNCLLLTPRPQDNWFASIVIALIAFIIVRAIKNQLAKVQVPPALTPQQVMAQDEQLRRARANQQAAVRTFAFLIALSLI